MEAQRDATAAYGTAAGASMTQNETGVDLAGQTLHNGGTLEVEGGGTGITTVVVLQSLAQARARWGQQEAAAIAAEAGGNPLFVIELSRSLAELAKDPAIASLDAVTYDEVREVAAGVADSLAVACVGPHEAGEF